MPVSPDRMAPPDRGGVRGVVDAEQPPADGSLDKIAQSAGATAGVQDQPGRTVRQDRELVQHDAALAAVPPIGGFKPGHRLVFVSLHVILR